MLSILMSFALADDARVTATSLAPINWEAAPKEVARFSAEGATWTVRCGATEGKRTCTVHGAEGRQAAVAASINVEKTGTTLAVEPSQQGLHTKTWVIIPVS